MAHIISAIYCLIFLNIGIFLPKRILQAAADISQNIKANQDLAFCGSWLAAEANIEIAKRVVGANPSNTGFHALSCQHPRLTYSLILVQQSNAKPLKDWPNLITRLVLHKE